MQQTTIKLQQTTRKALERFREGNETFDHVVCKLIHASHQRSLKEELIKGYCAQRKIDKELVNEWETASAEPP